MKTTVVSLGLALMGTAGSLFLSLGMGLKACPLCFYQRTFIMATAAVLGIGLLADRLPADRGRAALLSLVCIPLVIGGLGVASFHEYLVMTSVLECPKAIFGLGTAPAQSLAVFVVLSITVIMGAGRQSRMIALALLLGLLMAWGAIASSPPLPAPSKSPLAPVKLPLDTCRPVVPVNP